MPLGDGAESFVDLGQRERVVFEDRGVQRSRVGHVLGFPVENHRLAAFDMAIR